MTRRGTAAALALAAGFASLRCAAGPSGVPQPDGRSPAPEADGKPSRSGKLASVLQELSATADRRGFAASRRIALEDGRVRVMVFMRASASDADRRRVVEKYGVIVDKTADGLMSARVPVDALLDLSGDPAVSFVDLPDRPGI